MRRILIALAALSLFACAKAANDDLTDGTGIPVADAATPDTGPKGYGKPDASHPSTDAGTGAEDTGAPPEESDATVDPPDTNVDPPDTGTGGGTDCDPNNPIYSLEYFAALASGNIKACSSGCSATECCYVIACLAR